jgi:radical SAM superfamily enzyme YgiQ (UPF0313 family)
MPRNLYLFQPQHLTEWGSTPQYWFPYSVAVIWAYANQFPHIREQWQVPEIFFRREHVPSVLERISAPDVCAFSVYVWNHKYTVMLASAIKQRWPSCVLVFGGPQVTSSWLKHDFVDCLVLGEGEDSLAEILETVQQGRRPSQIIKKNRKNSLNDVPSPYASGVLDKLVADNPDVYWSASFETNRGCPYACTFCDWGGLTQSKIKLFTLERIQADIDWMSKHKVKTIFITDANFGIFKERDLEIARRIRGWIDLGTDLEYISMNYAKMSNEVVFDIAKEFGSINKGITFSVQSMNPNTLKAIKRENMKTNDIKNLIELGDQHNLHYYTELILGLPEETLESWKQGLCDLLEYGQHSRIEILLAMMMENTEMFTHQMHPYNMGTIEVTEFLPLAKDEAGIKESSLIVNQTNTMTTQELVEAYMYSWMITHWHINNYSKILAKYCYYVLNVSYRKFYDKLFDLLWTGGTTSAHHEFDKVKQALSNIYSKGNSGYTDISLSNLQFGSLYTNYQNLHDLQDLALTVARQFGKIDPGVIDIHHRVVYNERHRVPFRTKTKVNIETWQKADCVYDILTTQTIKQKNQHFFFSDVRRKKQIENAVIQVQD